MDLTMVGQALEELKRSYHALLRWQLSGHPERWVAARQGQWDNAAWQSLLTALRQSEFWPLDPAAVARVLEGYQREWWNLKRWRDAGLARRWVETHAGQWNHDDWLWLLASLRAGGYWPIDPAGLGRVLEEAAHRMAEPPALAGIGPSAGVDRGARRRLGGRGIARARRHAVAIGILAARRACGAASAGGLGSRRDEPAALERDRRRDSVGCRPPRRLGSRGLARLARGAARIGVLAGAAGQPCSPVAPAPHPTRTAHRAHAGADRAPGSVSGYVICWKVV